MVEKSITNNVLFIRTYSNVGLVQSIPEPMNFKTASPEGEPYKLCYKFASEPYKLYPNLYLRSMSYINHCQYWITAANNRQADQKFFSMALGFKKIGVQICPCSCV